MHLRIFTKYSFNNLKQDFDFLLVFHIAIFIQNRYNVTLTIKKSNIQILLYRGFPSLLYLLQRDFLDALLLQWLQKRYKKLFLLSCVMRIILCLISSHPEIWGKLFLEKYKKFLQSGFFYFSDFASSHLKYKKVFFGKNIRNFLILGLESTISLNIRNFFIVGFF